MQYVSELIGASVRDPAGHVVARVVDLLVPADADYPAVEALSLKPRKGDAQIVPWSAVHVLDNGAVNLFAQLSDTPTFVPPPNELSLARQVRERLQFCANWSVMDSA